MHQKVLPIIAILSHIIQALLYVKSKCDVWNTQRGILIIIGSAESWSSIIFPEKKEIFYHRIEHESSVKICFLNTYLTTQKAKHAGIYLHKPKEIRGFDWYVCVWVLLFRKCYCIFSTIFALMNNELFTWSATLTFNNFFYWWDMKFFDNVVVVWWHEKILNISESSYNNIF